MSSRRKFSPEFKAEAVELVISSGRPIVQVAKEIGVSDGSLGNSGLRTWWWGGFCSSLSFRCVTRRSGCL